MEYPILRYPDPAKPYTIYTDTRGIRWRRVLTQEDKDDKGRIKSQLNWVALTKEAYVIYMSVRRLTFYLTDAEITIKYDRLPLKNS